MIRTPSLRAALLAVGIVTPASAGLLAASAFAPAFAQSTRDATGDSGAEAYVQSEITRGLKILGSGLSRAEEKRQFYAMIDQVTDVPSITRFVLGKYGRTITPAQYAQFAPVFRDYADSVYESRLGDYHGETLKVTGSAVRKPGDVVVDTVVTGGKMAKPRPVSWRVINKGDGWKVVDVNVSGVWLALTQQQDFVSTLDNHQGNFNVLIGQLRSQTAAGAK